MLSYLYGWMKTPVTVLKPQTPNSKLQTKVTIIIPSRNEEQNISNCLASIARQKYPSDYFEVIVVDDHSTDNTGQIVRSQNNQKMKLIHLSGSSAGKKAAISEGIKNAKGKLIITTDADCTV